MASTNIAVTFSIITLKDLLQVHEMKLRHGVDITNVLSGMLSFSIRWDRK